MPHAYSQIAFTPAVRAVQERLGSRGQYAFLDDMPESNAVLGEREAAFIQARDTLFQATVSQTGWPYVQHRGGPVGFIKVLDASTLAYPDFRGNLQYLSVGNLSGDDRISIILLDLARQRRLKLLGHVKLVEAGTEPALFDRLSSDDAGATVERAFVVRIVGFDWNCPQHITPRFTEQEIVAMTAPLRERLERAERRVAILERPGRRAQVVPTSLGSGPLALVIAGIRQLTPRIRAFELRHADGSVLPVFAAGAHLALPVLLDDASASQRAYSISSDPAEHQRYEIAVLHEDAGHGGSRFAYAQWGLGTQLRVAQPSNQFPLRDGPHHTVLIAGGIGITPLKSMVHHLLGLGRSVALHHAARSRREAAYAEELTALLGLRYTLYASAEGARIDLAQLFAPLAQSDVHVYVCGPLGMIEAVRQQGAQAGLDSSRIHSERFVEPVRLDRDAPIEVELRRSGRVVQVSGQQSILEALEQAGVAAPSSCRIGMCRTCAVKVIAGAPEHRDDALSRAERERDGLMCICVSRARTATLVLDL